jgi:hypothetical protein
MKEVRYSGIFSAPTKNLAISPVYSFWQISFEVFSMPAIVS